jgi:hypothetical protein
MVVMAEVVDWIIGGVGIIAFSLLGRMSTAAPSQGMTCLAIWHDGGRWLRGWGVVDDDDLLGQPVLVKFLPVWLSRLLESLSFLRGRLGCGRGDGHGYRVRLGPGRMGGGTLSGSRGDGRKPAHGWSDVRGRREVVYSQPARAVQEGVGCSISAGRLIVLMMGVSVIGMMWRQRRWCRHCRVGGDSMADGRDQTTASSAEWGSERAQSGRLAVVLVTALIWHRSRVVRVVSRESGRDGRSGRRILVDGRVGDEGQILNPRLDSTHLGAV